MLPPADAVTLVACPATSPYVSRIAFLEHQGTDIVQRNCPTGGAPGVGRGAPASRAAFGAARGGFAGGAAAGGGRTAMCYKCGGPNHYARDCQAQAMKCYACGKLGHISKDCTTPNGGQLTGAGKTCYKCNEVGHIIRDCPQNAMNGNAPLLGAAGDVISPVTPSATVL